MLIYLNTGLGNSSYVNNATKASGTPLMASDKKGDPSLFQSTLDETSNSDISAIDPNIIAINKEDPDDREADMQLYLKFKKQGVDFSKMSFADFKKDLIGFPPVSAPGKIRNAINNILDSKENKEIDIGQLLFSFQDFIKQTGSDLNSLDTYKEFGSYFSNSLDVLLKNGDISQLEYNVQQNISTQLQNLTL